MLLRVALRTYSSGAEFRRCNLNWPPPEQAVGRTVAVFDRLGCWTTRRPRARAVNAWHFKRPVQPEALSAAYVFLAAPACASYITGTVLPVTGSVGAT